MDAFLTALTLVISLIFTVATGFRVCEQAKNRDWKGAMVESLLAFIGAAASVTLAGWLMEVL